MIVTVVLKIEFFDRGKVPRPRSFRLRSRRFCTSGKQDNPLCSEDAEIVHRYRRFQELLVRIKDHGIHWPPSKHCQFGCSLHAEY